MLRSGGNRREPCLRPSDRANRHRPQRPFLGRETSMAKKSVEELKAQYKGIQECQSEMSREGVSSKEPAMKQMANQLGKLDKEIKKAERSR